MKEENCQVVVFDICFCYNHSRKGGWRMEFWNRQIKLARYMLLATLIVTVLNIVFLLGNIDFYITYCAALPYYLVWFGKLFDNGLYLGTVNGEFTATGLVMAGIVLAAWLVVWWLSFGSRTWLKVGMVMVVADLGILLAAVFLLVALSQLVLRNKKK